jgi:hypothetical protein
VAIKVCGGSPSMFRVQREVKRAMPSASMTLVLICFALIEGAQFLEAASLGSGDGDDDGCVVIVAENSFEITSIEGLIQQVDGVFGGFRDHD